MSFGKVPMGSCRLGKSFWKVSNDCITEGDKVIFNRTNPLSKQLAI